MGIEWALTHNPSGIVPAPRPWHLLPTNVIPVYMEELLGTQCLARSNVRIRDVAWIVGQGSAAAKSGCRSVCQLSHACHTVSFTLLVMFRSGQLALSWRGGGVSGSEFEKGREVRVRDWKTGRAPLAAFPAHDRAVRPLRPPRNRTAAGMALGAPSAGVKVLPGAVGPKPGASPSWPACASTVGPTSRLEPMSTQRHA